MSKHFLDHVPIAGCLQMPCLGHASTGRSNWSWHTIRHCRQQGYGREPFLRDVRTAYEQCQHEFAEVRIDLNHERDMCLFVAMSCQVDLKQFFPLPGAPRLGQVCYEAAFGSGQRIGSRGALGPSYRCTTRCQRRSESDRKGGGRACGERKTKTGSRSSKRWKR